MIEQHPSPSSDGHQQENQDKGIAIIVSPLEGENVSINRTSEGGYTIFLRGDIAIAIAPSNSEASESLVKAGNGEGNGVVAETTSSKADAPHSESETPTLTESPEDKSPTPLESENKKYELVGNAVRDPYYKARKSGKLIADFTLATHDKKGTTRYWRIRGFDEVAMRIRDTVRKGQKDVEAVVYGPKYWTQKKKTKEGGWTQETVQGYYAGMVRVPEKYREKSEGELTQ